MPIFTTFGGASIRAYGFGATLAPAFVPANTLLFWSTSNRVTPPSGWSNYTTADDKFVRGTFTSGQMGTTVAANAIATATISVSTTTGGDHVGVSFTMTGNTTSIPGSSPVGYLHYNAPGGTHTHTTLTATVGGVVPDMVRFPVIITSSNTSTIPANTVIFRKTVPSSGNYTALSTGIPAGRTYGFYGGGSAKAYANATGFATGSLNSTGSHDHLNVSSVYGAAGPYGLGAGTDRGPGYIGGGSHTHTANVPVVAVPKSKYLNAWVSSFDEAVEYGMILMYIGDTTRLPAGWRLCDGTLGTPDMTNYFLCYRASASHGDLITDTPFVGNDPDNTRPGATTSTANPHTHSNGTTRPAFPGYMYNGLHSTYDAAHSHTVTVSASTASAPGYYPDHLLVAFIQYKGI